MRLFTANGVDGLEIDGIASLGRAGVDAIAQDEREARANRDDDLLVLRCGCNGAGSSLRRG
jgi:hypothetical protein